jgi:uncharacterized protein YdhG (YjbR/CyaY superfamily)
MQKRPPIKNVTEYIALAPKAWQPMLKKLRATIKAAAPQAEESISYMIAGYKQHGPVVYFSHHADHCSLHAISSSIMEKYEKELKPFKSKGKALHFTVDHPIPMPLVTKLVKARLKENEAHAKAK